MKRCTHKRKRFMLAPLQLPGLNADGSANLEGVSGLRLCHWCRDCGALRDVGNPCSRWVLPDRPVQRRALPQNARGKSEAKHQLHLIYSNGESAS